jgi:hypothetical protein
MVKTPSSGEKRPPLPRAGDFRVLSLPLPSPPTLLASSFAGVAAVQQLPKAELAHCIFFRKHSARKNDPARPEGRTLFLCGLPADTTEHHLRALFAPFGSIESVEVLSPPHPDEKLHRLREDGLAPQAAAAPATQSTDDDEEGLHYLPVLPVVGSCTGYLVFEDDEEADNALQMRVDPSRTWPVLKASKQASAPLFGMARECTTQHFSLSHGLRTSVPGGS